MTDADDTLKSLLDRAARELEEKHSRPPWPEWMGSQSSVSTVLPMVDYLYARHCVNSHGALVAALETVLEFMPQASSAPRNTTVAHIEAANQAREALRQAKEETQ